MRRTLLAVVLGFIVLGSFAQASASNHVDMTSAILDFLSRTELCLNSCRDAASAQAAIPQLQALKEECSILVKEQQNLPEPTIQDYMAVQNKMEVFTTIWNAIRNHIERMEQARILSPELRQILQIAPNSSEN